MNKSGAQYVEVSRRGAWLSNIGGMAIALLIVATCATSWTRFGVALGLHVLMVPLNIAITVLVIPRLGVRAEIYRVIINGVVCCGVYAYLDWPIASWLWLPFIALTTDRSGGKHVLVTVILTCAIQDASALFTGLPWAIPTTFTLLAGLAYLISGARTSIIREMLVRAEQQRDELEAAHVALKAEVVARERAELELRQAQKLEAVGRLAAGIAHEINTPMQSIGNSIEFAREAFGELFASREGLVGVADLDDLETELPSTLALAAEGCERVMKIVRSMRQFAGPQEVAAFDVNEAVDATLAISRHEYALVADVTRSLEPVPTLVCNAGEINQVLLNLIVNAAHAVEDVVAKTGGRGSIEVATRLEGDRAVIAVADTGRGIDPAVRDLIFEPFFTTKQVGRGTGQGLSISRSIVERHGGTLTFSSVVGQGTTFEMRLPLAA